MTPASARALQAVEAAGPMSDSERAIARSVVYASLFDYPLSLAQLRQTLIESIQTPSEILATYQRCVVLQGIVDYQEGFFFPRGRRELIAERRRRESRSRRFLGRHRLLLAAICSLPYVRLVALSGSIAHMNLEGSGDLDLFIVTRGRHVWSVAVASVLLAKAFGRRRTLCVNFVLADTALVLEQQDLFSASQIIHLKPLIGGAMYQALLAANPFVAHFYPNFHATRNNPLALRRRRWSATIKALIERALAAPAWFVERICQRAYGAYLRRRSSTWQSPDQVRLADDCLKLHTQSHRRAVLTRFEQAVREVVD